MPPMPVGKEKSIILRGFLFLKAVFSASSEIITKKYGIGRNVFMDNLDYE